MVVLSVMALVASLGVKLVGFPAQLRHGKTSQMMSGSMCVSYAIWTCQGALALDWALVWSSAVGVVLCTAMLAQSLRRNRKARQAK